MRGHLHATCGDRTEDAADQRTDDHFPIDAHTSLQQRGDDRDHHADRTDLVASARSRG